MSGIYKSGEILVQMNILFFEGTSCRMK